MKILRSAWVLPITSPPIHDGAVVVEGPEIVAVGPSREILTAYGDRALGSFRSHAPPIGSEPAGPGGAARPPDATLRGTPDPDPSALLRGAVVDLGDALLLPALANVHTHLELSWMAAAPPPRGDLISWTRAVIARRPPAADEVESVIRDALGTLRSRGVALIGDVGNTTAALGPLAAAGIQGCFFLELIRRRPENPDPIMEAEGRLSSLPDASDRSRTDRGCLRVSLVPHSATAGALSPGLLKEIGERALRRGDTVSIHVAESRADVDFLANGSGPLRSLFEEIGAIGPGWTPPGLSPAEVLDEAGLLGPRTLAVHGVHLSRADARLLAQRGATVVLCPRSNAWIGVGQAPVSMLLEENVPLALGTDSLASNEDLDILSELAALRELAPRVAPSALLRAATLGGAAALGLAGSFGSLDPGKQAALVALRRGTARGPQPSRSGASTSSPAWNAMGGSLERDAEPWATLFSGASLVSRVIF